MVESAREGAEGKGSMIRRIRASALITTPAVAELFRQRRGTR